jgi:two-component system NtrC family response regulator
MKILLADDDKSVRRVIQFKLGKEGFDVTAVEDGQQALDSLRQERFDLLLADIRMPKLDGIELLKQSQAVQPGLKIILITAHATVSQAVEAVKLGAFDYITKPFEDEELFVAIDKALAFKKLERENRLLKKQLHDNERPPTLAGTSAPFRKMMATIKKIAGTEATVLLIGESGTGKELVARTIHHLSTRADGEFIAINCAAIPKDLLESELFGHVRGAFTGAVKDKRGKFEMANGGTLLLDEISELASDLQAKLLRVLQERVIEPVGSELKKEIDVRIIAATNVNLKERVYAGDFREDLYYRLNVIPITLPSLRQRADDIPILAKEFIHKFGKGSNISISPKLMDNLMAYEWPGNIRELENLIERMAILRMSDELSPKDLPEDFGKPDARMMEFIDIPSNEHMTYQETEKSLITDALNRCGWNRTKAAKYINIPRHVLVYRMKKYGISPND